jgi:hypothetical protein
VNIQAGLARLKYAGGRATLRELASWCDVAQDTSEAGVEGYSRAGLLRMAGELSSQKPDSAHQITPGLMDATFAIGTPRPILMSDAKQAFEYAESLAAHEP